MICQIHFQREVYMPKALCPIIFSTVYFIVGTNTGELTYLLNLGTAICLTCYGVG